MKYRVRHTTSYAYASKVDLASHVLHLSPRRLAYQRVGAVSITADPDPTRRSEGVDHFGNGVVRLFLDLPHRAFEVTLTAVAARNLAHGVQLTDTDHARLMLAAQRITGILENFA